MIIKDFLELALDKELNHNGDEMSMETAAKFIPKLFSSLGDIYEEK